MFIRVIDFEASGDAPDGEVIEVGWADLLPIGRVEAPCSIRIRNTRPISVETMAVHHLTEGDLVTGETREAAFAALASLPEDAFDLWGDPDAAYAAHSAKFERAWWPEATLPWICTYKCAVRLWPDSPRHSNQVLRYYLGLDLDPAYAMPPHRAAPDAYVTAHILRKMLEIASFEDLIKWSNEPTILPRVTFGKNPPDGSRGMRWTEIDDGLLWWVVDKDFDEDVMATARHEIDRRQQERETEAQLQRADEPQEETD